MVASRKKPFVFPAAAVVPPATFSAPETGIQTSTIFNDRFTTTGGFTYGGESVWNVSLADRKSGDTAGTLVIGRDTGSIHTWEED